MTAEQKNLSRRWFPTVYDFSCFRNFLNTYAQSMKEKDSNFNYSSWARDLGLKATTSITMVLHGQRTCGPQIREKLERYFAFDDREKKYFDCLVRMDRFSDDERMKEMVLDELKRIAPKQVTTDLSEQEQSELKTWLESSLQQLSQKNVCSEQKIGSVINWLETQLADENIRSALKSHVSK